MGIKIHSDIEQGSPEWYALRLGLLTASEMKFIITPAKLEYAKNEKEKTHLYELAAQRVNSYVEPQFQSYDMMRGKEEEILARKLYAEKFAPIQEVGFVTNDDFTFELNGEKKQFMLGCSPDGLVGDDGGIQIKSRVQKYQFETIVGEGIPVEYIIQVQTELLVTQRQWWDFCSYSNGMNMMVRRCYPDPKIQAALKGCAETFHARLESMMLVYQERIKDSEARIIPVERVIHPDHDIQPSDDQLAA